MRSDRKGDYKESVTDRDTFRVLILLEKMREPLTIAQIREFTGLSIDAVKGQIKRLRRCGRVRRLAYGLWELVPVKYGLEFGESVTPTPGVTSHTPPSPLVLHDNVFRAKVTLSGSAFDALGTRFRGAERKNFGWQLRFDGYSVSVMRDRVVLYCSRRFYGPSFDVCMRDALSYGHGVMAALLKDLGVSGRFLVEWTERHHYARENDGVARVLRLKGDKVRVPLKRGSFVIDFSDHVDHAEVQSGRGLFMDGCWRPFVEDLEKCPGFTPLFQMGMNDGFQKQFALVAVAIKNIKDVLEKLGGVRDG